MCVARVGGGFNSGISKSENRHLEMDVAPPAIVGRIEIGLDHYCGAMPRAPCGISLTKYIAHAHQI